VGSLAHAAVAHYRSSALAVPARPRLLSVEPDTAACVLRSLAARRHDLGLGPVPANGGTHMPVIVCICTEGPLTDRR
jgi:hypothetical protein